MEPGVGALDVAMNDRSLGPVPLDGALVVDSKVEVRIRFNSFVVVVKVV